MRLQQWVSEGDLNSDGVIDEQEFRSRFPSLLMGSNNSNPTPDTIDSVYLAGCYVRHWAKSCTRIGWMRCLLVCSPELTVGLPGV